MHAKCSLPFNQLTFCLHVYSASRITVHQTDGQWYNARKTSEENLWWYPEVRARESLVIPRD